MKPERENKSWSLNCNKENHGKVEEQCQVSNGANKNKQVKATTCTTPNNL